ncbi:aminoglycoside phosphotransferase (APT) family kinase protein [Catenulispora sp. GP43]|uniref:phosphotransferase family protein n=1 Tax=Catenulispora sp. GP43 TaxID=3156263 RepID=UPI003514D173
MSEADAVRGEDAFDVAAVHAWLGEQGEQGESPQVWQGEPPQVRQFSGGASNLTYLLAYPGRELILRRPPRGTKASSAHDMRREYRVQSLLRPVFPYVPEMVAMCTDPSVIGSDFYVMERIPGTIVRTEWPDGVSLTEDQAAGLCRNVFDRLIDLHSVDPAAAGLADLGKGPGYVGRQVSGWTDRYRKALTPDAPDFDAVIDWLAAHQPHDVGACVIHNDYRLDNIVLDPAQPWDSPTAVRGVLDWEMATVGDPLMDLGSALAYWVQADDNEEFGLLRRQPTTTAGMLTRAQIVAYYGERTGRDVAAWPFYETFGLFRLAVIVQQIYYRYFHGQTTNPAFKHFGFAAVFLRDQALRAMAG